MGKIIWKPGNMIYPIPAVMVSIGTKRRNFNIITVCWTGTICTNPALCYISVKPDRYSYQLLKETGDFVINLTTKKLVRAVDWCGVKSGKDFDKFNEMNLTPVKASKVKSPLILESPVNIECIIKEIKALGSHDMFIAEIVAVNADEKYINTNTGHFNFNAAEPLCYSHGKYYQLGEYLGKFGFSIEKKKLKKRKK